MMTNNAGLSGMAPEDAFALGIQKGLQLVKELGRNGDSELAHVNPEEKEMLEAQGGAGTRNPATGMPEFFSDMEGERGRDTGVGGGGSDRGAAGGGNRSDMERERGRQTGVRGVAAESQSGGGGTATNPTSAGGTISDMEANRGQSNPADDRNFGQRLADGIAAALQGPSFGPPNSRDPGFLGVGASMFPGIGWGMGLTRALQGMGLSSTEDFGDPDAEQRDDRMMSPAAPRQQQPQGPQYPWQRPDSMPNAPMGLGFDAGMSPLQQRTAVATGGTNADAGVYRDPGVIDFYRNLALFDLTEPGGAPRSGADVTDIERQYVGQLGGQPGSTVQEFLKALSGLRGFS